MFIWRTPTHTPTHTPTPTHPHIYKPTYIYTPTHTPTHTSTPIHTHTHAHTHNIRIEDVHLVECGELQLKDVVVRQRYRVARQLSVTSHTLDIVGVVAGCHCY